MTMQERRGGKRRRAADLARTRVEPRPLAGGITNQNFMVEDRGRPLRRAGRRRHTRAWRRARERAGREPRGACGGLSARAWCMRSRAFSCSISSRGAPSRRRTCATRPISSAWSTWCGAATATFRSICAGPARCSGCSTSCATMRTRCATATAATLPLLPDLLDAGRAAGSGRRPDRGRVRPQRSARRQLHRRRQAALAGRLGICRLQLAAVRSRRARLQQRASAEPQRSSAARSSISAGRSTMRCAAAPPP